jgi:hypothetical protein
VADRFTDYVETYEPYDAVAFFGGSVEPGETVVVSVVITDTTPRYQFYLLQKRDSPLALMPGLPRDRAPVAGRATVVSALLAPPRAARPHGRALGPKD